MKKHLLAVAVTALAAGSVFAQANDTLAKIKASGADSVVTGNWGTDLSLLIKAAKDAGLAVDFYTYYAVTSGVPTAMAVQMRREGRWDYVLLGFGLVVMVLAFIRHRANIQRLIAGTESKAFTKKTPKS